MSLEPRPSLVRLVALLTGLVCVIAAAAAASPAPAATAPTRLVKYGSVSLQVPMSWRVVKLDGTRECVRLDRDAIYLGAAPAQQDCPAHVVGRADTIWLRPGDKAPANATRKRVGSLSMAAHRDRSNSLTAVAADRNVTVEAGWKTSSTTVDAALATMRSDASTPVPQGSSQAPSTSAAPAPRANAAAPAPTGSAFNGMGMDTCAAPSAATMSAWGASPYRAVGVYLGGSMRACPDGNLSASWIDTVSRAGWGVIPIYVGPQAPCVQQQNLATIDPADAVAEGVSNAQDAIAKANKFGLPVGSPIYYDMEHYIATPSCTGAVLDFLTGWTNTLHQAGYRSAAYGNTNSLMKDMSLAITNSRPNFVAPDQIWYAQWDYKQTLDGSPYVPEFRSDYWAQHQRMKQYTGGVTETWGGVSMNVDQNWIDTYLPGNATNVDYGSWATGPGGAGFLFTGPMNTWRPMPGVGAQGRAYWTGATSAAQEVNGATWTPPNQAAGTYRVRASIPAQNATATLDYQVTDSTGTHAVRVDQSAVAGSTADLGTFTASDSTPIVVHVGDKDATGSTTSRIAVDSVSLTPTAPPAAAVAGVRAVAGDSSATVSWTEPGGPVQSYRVTAQPGGQSTTVPVGTATASITGLTDNSASTFTVVPVNSAGDGPAATSNAVVPQGTVGLTAVTPTRLLDTRNGAGVDPRRGAIAAGATIRMRVAGVPGSRVPAGATAVVVDVISPSPVSGGWIAVPGVDPGGTTATQVVAGRTTDSGVTLPIDNDGWVSFTNRTGGSQHLIVDVQGYFGADAPGWTTTDPVRVGDTRSGAPGSAVVGAIPANGTRTFRVAGVGGVPASARSVRVSLQALDPTGSGYLSLGTATSALNFAADPFTSNEALVQLDDSGSLTVRNTSNGSVHVAIDVRGYGTTAAPSLTTVGARRVYDSRSSGKVAPQGSVQVPVTQPAVPGAATARTAFVLVTNLGPQARGGLAVASSPSTALTISSEPTVSRSAVIALPIAADGTVAVSNRTAAPADLLVDVVAFGS